MTSYPPAFPGRAVVAVGRTAAATIRRLPRLPHRLAFLLVLCLGLVACTGSDLPDERARLNERRLGIMRQFAVAQNEVRNTQAEALGHPDLQPLRERFNALLRERILEIDPTADTLLDRALVVGNRMEEMSRPIVLEEGQEPPEADRAAVASEFRALEKAIRPLQQQALAEPAVFAAFTALQDSLHATMVGMRPDIEPALIRMETLSSELEEVDGELRALGP